MNDYRSPKEVARWVERIHGIVTRPWTVMEICGGQTHAILQYGLDSLLPDKVSLVHGPGCPVCVTPQSVIDEAIALAERPEVILCTFGDMLRVPGSVESLQAARSRGGDIRIVYSPLDAVLLAEAEPLRQVVFLAVGFETTAAPNAAAIQLAAQKELVNFSMLVSQVRVPPAMDALLDDPDCRVRGFLAAGHVCTVMGLAEYEAIAARHHVPVVVTGFEPVDLLAGLYACLAQLEAGDARVENAYPRAVRSEGNLAAQALLAEVFMPQVQYWRGIGLIAHSGLVLREAYAHFDASKRFPDLPRALPVKTECISGLVLKGRAKPTSCPAFGGRCTPDRPLGAPMVSAEGVCAAYYRCHQLQDIPS